MSKLANKIAATLENVVPTVDAPVDTQAHVADAPEAAPEAPEAQAPVATAPVESKPAKSVQAIMVSGRDHTLFSELKNEFFGPGATKETALTSEEGFALLLEVATDARFTYVPKTDDEGHIVSDTDGQPEMIQIDRFERAAKKIFAARSQTSNKSKIERLQAQLDKLQGKKA